MTSDQTIDPTQQLIQAYLERVREATGKSFSSPDDEGFVDANRRYLRLLQERVEDIADESRYKSDYDLPLKPDFNSGQWDPAFAAYADKFIDGVRSEGRERETSTYQDQTRMGNLVTRTKTDRGAVRHNEFLDEKMRPLAAELDAAREFHLSVYRPPENVAGFKQFLSTRGLTSIDQERVYERNHAFPINSNETAIPALSEDANDFAFGFGLFQGRQEAQEILNSPEIRQLTGMPRIPESGLHGPELIQAYDRFVEAIGGEENVYGAVASLKNDPEKGIVFAEFMSRYKDLSASDRQTADNAMVAGVRRALRAVSQADELEQARDYTDRVPSIRVPDGVEWDRSYVHATRPFLTYLTKKDGEAIREDLDESDPYYFWHSNKKVSDSDKNFVEQHAGIIENYILARNQSFEDDINQQGYNEMIIKVAAFAEQQGIEFDPELPNAAYTTGFVNAVRAAPADFIEQFNHTISVDLYNDIQSYRESDITPESAVAIASIKSNFLVDPYAFRPDTNNVHGQLLNDVALNNDINDPAFLVSFRNAFTLSGVLIAENAEEDPEFLAHLTEKTSMSLEQIQAAAENGAIDASSIAILQAAASYPAIDTLVLSARDEDLYSAADFEESRLAFISNAGLLSTEQLMAIHNQPALNFKETLQMQSSSRVTIDANTPEIDADTAQAYTETVANIQADVVSHTSDIQRAANYIISDANDGIRQNMLIQMQKYPSFTGVTAENLNDYLAQIVVLANDYEVTGRLGGEPGDATLVLADFATAHRATGSTGYGFHSLVGYRSDIQSLSAAQASLGPEQQEQFIEYTATIAVENSIDATRAMAIFINDNAAGLGLTIPRIDPANVSPLDPAFLNALYSTTEAIQRAEGIEAEEFGFVGATSEAHLNTLGSNTTAGQFFIVYETLGNVHDVINPHMRAAVHLGNTEALPLTTPLQPDFISGLEYKIGLRELTTSGALNGVNEYVIGADTIDQPDDPATVQAFFEVQNATIAWLNDSNIIAQTVLLDGEDLYKSYGQIREDILTDMYTLDEGAPPEAVAEAQLSLAADQFMFARGKIEALVEAEIISEAQGSTLLGLTVNVETPQAEQIAFMNATTEQINAAIDGFIEDSPDGKRIVLGLEAEKLEELALFEQNIDIINAQVIAAQDRVQLLQLYEGSQLDISNQERFEPTARMINAIALASEHGDLTLTPEQQATFDQIREHYTNFTNIADPSGYGFDALFGVLEAHRTVEPETIAPAANPSLDVGTPAPQTPSDGEEPDDAALVAGTTGDATVGAPEIPGTTTGGTTAGEEPETPGATAGGETPASTANNPLPAEVQVRMRELQEAWGWAENGMPPTEEQQELLGNYMYQVFKRDYDPEFSSVVAFEGKAYTINEDGKIFEADDDGNAIGEEVADIRNIGSPDQPPHGFVFHVLKHALEADNTAEELFDEKTNFLITRQLRALDELTGDRKESEELFSELQDIEGNGAKREFLKRKFGDDNMEAVSMFIAEQVRLERFLEDPNAIEINRYFSDYTDYHRLAGLHDLVSHYMGEFVNTLDNERVNDTDVALPSEVLINDRYFDSRVYEALDRGQPVDKWLITGEESDRGVPMSRQEVAEEALRIFERNAAEMGIDQADVSKAIFEGKLNPYFDDLKLVYEGLGKPTGHDMSLNQLEEKIAAGETQYAKMHELVKAEVEAEIRFMREIGEIPEGGDLTDTQRTKLYDTPLRESLFQGVFAGHRNAAWNERFGSLRDMGDNISTVVNGQDVTVSADDIGLRMMMRFRGNQFIKAYGLDKLDAEDRGNLVKFDADRGILVVNPDLRYEEFQAHLETLPQSVQNAFAQEFSSYMDHQSAFSYYNLRSLDNRSQFNLNADYMQLRSERYYPDLERRMGVEDEFVFDRKTQDEYKEKPGETPIDTFEDNMREVTGQGILPHGTGDDVTPDPAATPAAPGSPLR